MLGAAIIVFRETLEAALLLGIIAAAARSLPGRNRWLLMGLTAGLAGSLAVAAMTGTIAEWADGVGQELFNAAVLGLAVLMLAWHNIWMARHAADMVREAKTVVSEASEGRRALSAIALVVALAVLREGSETVLFLFGLASGGLSAAQVASGGALGLAGGAIVGYGLYAGQMARFLIQGDLLPPLASPLWDTSALLPMDSALGSLLHVLAGYDARPSGMQTLFYVGILLAILAGMRWARVPRPPIRA